MKDPGNEIRKWFYNVLYGTVYWWADPSQRGTGTSVPVYSFAPKDAEMPYIVIGEQSMDAEIGPKDSYMTSNNIVLEIYSSHTGNDASYHIVNNIAEDVLQLVRQRAMETHGSGGQSITSPINGYNYISLTLAGSQTERFIFENSIVIYKGLNINLVLEEQ